jgi:hypothetical protein
MREKEIHFPRCFPELFALRWAVFAFVPRTLLLVTVQMNPPLLLQTPSLVIPKPNFQKMIGWEGGSFQAYFTKRSGDNLGQYTNPAPLQQYQEVYGRGQTWRITTLWFKQKFCDDLLEWNSATFTPLLLLSVGPLHYGVLPKKKVPCARTPGGALHAGAAPPTSTQTRLG